MSILAILLASLLGSPHCAGMCGGFVACYSGASDGRFAPHLSYNAGRLLVYCLLGAVAGFVGSFVDDLGILVGVQRISSIFTGVLLLYWGIRGVVHRGSSGSSLAGSRLYARLQGVFRYVLTGREVSWAVRAFLLGVLSTFLPCGWLYMFVAVAAATGTFAGGMLVMAVFWLGTLPALLSLGLFTGVLGTRMRAKVPLMTSVLLLVAGLFALFGKVDLMAQVQDVSEVTTRSCH